jgi:molybdopterin-guanine dinucleotide biosynthesis protein B
MDNSAIIQVVGYKNSGKTTLVCKLIRSLSAQGLSVGSIKHDAHQFEIDYPGKDTWLHREAGAAVVAITSQDKTAIMEQRSTTLEDILTRMDGMDVIIIEGYKFASYPKIVMVKDEAHLELLNQATNVIAIVSWIPYQHAEIPVISIQHTDQLVTKINRLVAIKQGGDHE